MKTLSLLICALFLATLSGVSATPQIIRLKPGFVYRLRCEGRLLVSSIGNDSLLRIEALPKEIGCGVIAKPIALSGITNLLIETSTGSLSRIVEVSLQTPTPKNQDLDIELNNKPAGVLK